MASGGNVEEVTEDWIEFLPMSPEVKKRGEKSMEVFIEKFHARPEYFIRVPGRVNLIGEHIDYCGYGVFPMAIEQDVFLSLRTIPSPMENGKLCPIFRLANTDPVYDNFECSLDQIKSILALRIIGQKPAWHYYFLCGVQGMLEHFSLIDGDKVSMSFEVSLSGNIPQRGGLSSSSAVVCAAAIATLIANDLKMRKDEMASLCAKSERYIGTEGGGMDQAIALLAIKGTAQLIEFVPRLHGEKVKLPANAIFVIANSLVEANKAASNGFNTRVIECRIATWVLAKKNGIQNFFQFSRLKDFQDFKKLSLEDMKSLIQKDLHQEPYELYEVGKVLHIGLSELLLNPLMKRYPLDLKKFQLYNRAKHVIEEAERVYKFRAACVEGRLDVMGRLMRESHDSLRQLYDCSHPQLDTLVQISDGITYGARLTGAGWGGCMVALLDQSQLSTYFDALRTKFYMPFHGITTPLTPRHIFASQPGPGATTYLP